MLRVRLLGELEAVADGAAVAMPASRRARALLGWLALHPGEHARGAVAARFWPDVLDSSARASLRSSLVGAAAGARRRRRAGGGPRAHRRCAARPTSRLRRADAAGQLEAAVALRRGPLLAGLDDDWVLEARDAHAERLGAALARLAASRRRPRAAPSGWARRRLELDPLDEEAARDLMRAAGRRGRPVRGARGRRPRSPSACARRSASPRPRRRGRSPRVARGRRRSPRARAPRAAGRGRARGPCAPSSRRSRRCGRGAGPGAAAGRARAARAGSARRGSRRSARARPGGGGARAAAPRPTSGARPPFVPWAELLAHLAGELDPPEPRRHLAGGARPARARRCPAARPAAVEWRRRPGRPRARPAVRGGGRARRARHGRRGRSSSLFDDVHFADAPRLELAAYVARRIARLPVLIVLTRRGVPRRDAVDGLAHAARGRGVACAELDARAAAPCASRAARRRGGHAGAPQRERVVAAADGNPLLALESARAAARGDAGPPSSLRATVRAAVGRLPAAARRTAELAAVAGRDLDRAELLAARRRPARWPRRSTAACSAAPRAASATATRCCATPSAPTWTTAAAGAARGAGQAAGRPARRGRPPPRLAGRPDLAVGRLLAAAADARGATALEEAAGFLRRGGRARAGRPSPAWSSPRRRRSSGDRAKAAGDSTGRSAPRPGDGRPAARTRARRAGSAGRSATRPRGPPARWRSTPRRRPGRRRRAGPSCCDPRVERGDDGAPTPPPVARASSRSCSTRRRAAAAPRPRHGAGLRRPRARPARRGRGGAGGMGAAGERVGRADMAYGGWAHAAPSRPRRARGSERSSTPQRGAVGTAARRDRVPDALLLAYTLARIGRLDEARAASAAGRARRPAGPPRPRGGRRPRRGLVALLAGDHERAAELLGGALDGDPPVLRAEARLRGAEALANLGRPDEAEQDPRRRARAGQPQGTTRRCWSRG